MTQISHVAAYITLQSVGEPPQIFADLLDKVLVMVSDLLKQLLMKVLDSLLGIFSGVTLLVYLFLAKCDIRVFWSSLCGLYYFGDTL